MIYDICTFNGESELFEIRYNILKDFVDEFRVIEFDETFSGKPKPVLFAQNWPEVKSYYITEDIWSKYEDEAKESPNTQYGRGAKHWITEWAMKESLKEVLTDLKDDDIVLVSDCDEIPDFNKIDLLDNLPIKLKLKVYTYWLNNRSSEEFWGTLITTYKHIKENCLNHLRSNELFRTDEEMGFHFTSLGGYEKVKEKLTDSYTAESYATSQVLGNLENNIRENKDFLGRNFTYRIDESEWPEFLKTNRDKYKHLCLTNLLQNSNQTVEKQELKD
ncbi:MAG: hypothetical protein AABY15_03795 [Nanoarchaeota archaeon]